MAMVVMAAKSEPKAHKREAEAIPAVIRITAVAIIAAVVAVTGVRRIGIIGVVMVAMTIAVIDIVAVVMPPVVGFLQQAGCHWHGGARTDLPRSEWAGRTRRARQDEAADSRSSHIEYHFRRAGFDHGKIPPLSNALTKIAQSGWQSEGTIRSAPQESARTGHL